MDGIWSHLPTWLLNVKLLTGSKAGLGGPRVLPPGSCPLGMSDLKMFAKNQDSDGAVDLRPFLPGDWDGDPASGRGSCLRTWDPSPWTQSGRLGLRLGRPGACL